MALGQITYRHFTFDTLPLDIKIFDILPFDISTFLDTLPLDIYTFFDILPSALTSTFPTLYLWTFLLFGHFTFGYFTLLSLQHFL